jgi:class 3 adenylate cyclase/tetratricopeptide (TPR) repeat protein
MLAIVFTDLVNSTLISSLLPGEDRAARDRSYIETIKAPHCHRLMAGLEAAGGRMVKDTGDGFLLVFDDPMKAVRWAMAVQRSHREDPIATPVGALEVKIGLHVGTPPANPIDPGDYIGQDVNVAARLCALPVGGQVMVSELIAVLVRGAQLADVAIHPHGDRELKGIGRVPVFELAQPGRRPGSLKQPAASPTNLPPPPEGFVGRNDLLEQVRAQMRAGGVTVLKGEGGMGKTMLALKAAHDARAEDELAGGVAWLNCELAPGREQCLRQMARVFFGDRMEEEPIDACERRIAEHLGRGDALVVFDNFETVYKDARVVHWLRDLRAPARALVTTRNLPAGFNGRVIRIDELRPAEARALFLERASRAGADPAGPEVDEICAAVGRQPLAIELLAARAAMVPLHRLLERVKKGADVIARTSDPDDGDRHRTAKLCIEWSFKDLSAPARDLLRRMCVLPDGASIGSITAVLGTEDWDEAAEELVAASVWRLSGRRWTMHPLVRSIALEQLGEGRGELERQAARSLARFLHERGAEARRHAADPAAIKGVIDWCAAELRNLVGAAEFAFAVGDWESVSRIATALFHIFQLRGHWSDAERLYTLSLAAARRSGDRAGQAEALNHLGWVYRQQGRWTEAEASHRESLPLWRAIGDPRGEGHTLKHLGRMLQVQGRLDESDDACRQALDLLRAAGDPVGEVRTLIYLGNIRRFQERWDQALATYEQALAVSRQVGDLYDEGEILRHLGRVHRRQGRRDEARLALQRSLTIWRAFDDRYNEALILDALGAVLRDEGHWAESEAMLQQGLAVFREFGDRRKEGGALLNLAELDAARGAQASALERGHQAIAILEGTQDQWLLDGARRFVAEMSRRQARPH